MKLTKLFNLTEGLRFGSKENRDLMKFANDVILGVEYEMHVNRDALQGALSEDELDEQIADEVHRQMEEIIEQHVQTVKSDYIQGELDQWRERTLYDDMTGIIKSIYKTVEKIHATSAGELSSDIYEYVEMAEKADEGEELTDDELEELSSFQARAIKFQSYMNDISSDVTFLYDNRSELEELKYLVSHTIKEIEDIEEYISDFDDDINELESIDFSNLTEIAEMEQDIFERLDGHLEMYNYSIFNDDSKLDATIESIIEDAAEESFDDDVESILGYDPEDVVSHPSYDFVYSDVESEVRLDNGDSSISLGTELLKEFLPQRLYSMVNDVVPERSVEDGMEIISEPLPMREQFEFMDAMFEFIDEYGSTSESTGMHVNISLRGLKFTRDNFNFLKFILLADTRYMQSIDKYPPRVHVGRLFTTVDSDALKMLATIYKDVGWDGFESTLRSVMVQGGQKSIAINIKNALHEGEYSRIELRYFGGADYQERAVELQKDIKRAAYAVLAAYSEKFAHKEYVNAILRELNKHTKEHFSHTSDIKIDTFLDLVKNIDKLEDDG